jgi:alpha-glucoside transport system permease protein
VIATLKIFDIVNSMTGGNFSTNVLANDMYTKSFTQGLPGYGAALAVVLFIAVVPIVFVNARNQKELREAR